MKRLITLGLILIACVQGRAQTAASYNFTTTTGTFTSISATGTIMGSSFFGDDRNQSGVPIGFTFSFCGTNYTQLSACSNGWLSLANSTSTALTNSAANVVGAGMLMAYWDDLNGAGCTAYYQTTGTAPNRVFTFEWKNWGTWTGSGNANMQVKLYETTNAIEYWYGSSTYASHSGTIGIANSTTDWQTLPNVSAAPTPSSTTFTSSLTTSPASGQVYKWFICPVTVTASNSGTVCPGSTVTLTGTSSGTSYLWTGPGGYTSTQLSPVITNATTAGVYTLAASDGSCTSTATTTVSLLTAPAAPIVTPAVANVCEGSTTTLTATLPPSAINLVPLQGWETGLPTVAGTPVEGWNTTATSTAYITRATAGSYPTASPHTGSYMADFHSWSYSTINVSLISPSFSMSGITGGQVSFWMYRDIGYNTATYNTEGLTVYVNTTASATGATNLAFIPRRGGLAPTGTVTGTATTTTNGWYQYTVNIPATFTGATNYVIFNFNSNYGNDIYFDDVSITGNQHIAPPVWTPATYLFSDAGATTAYAGDTLLTVYQHPTGVTAPTTIYYVATITNGTCTAKDTAIVTVNPPVPAITGSSDVCVSTSATLGNTLAGGTWSVSNTTVATIEPTTGIVHGVTTGVDTVYYTMPSGCFAYVVINVTTYTTPTVGMFQVCNGGYTTMLSNPTTGGTWTTSNAAVASVNLASGLVTSGAAGSAVITYTLPNGCTDTTVISVLNNPPAIEGSPNVCYNGGTTTLADSFAGGTWASSNMAVATVDSLTGVVTGVAAGAATITFTSVPGCYATLPLVLLANPAPITGTAAVCEAGSVTVLSDATTGGTWSSSADSIASVSAAGEVTGGASGTTTITYTAANACYTTRQVTVNPLPAAITGTTQVCQLASTTLASATAGGTWSSGAVSTATVSGTGTVYGINPGVASITYTLPTGCIRTADVTVNQIPAMISGNNFVCNGSTTTLSDSVAGGTWATSAPLIATVSPGGVVYGLTTGAFTVTYATGSAGCYRTKDMTVNPLVTPSVSIAASTGTTVCAGTSVTFNSAITNGGSAPLYVWSVNNVILASGTSYSYTPANGDLVRLWILSNYQCASPDTASSWLNMTVNPIVIPAVSLSTGIGDTVCAENVITITPNPVNGGSAPVYQWSVNGVASGSGPVYSYMPANGDVVQVIMTSNAPCATTTTATSTKILTVSPYVTPYITMSSLLGPSMCEGYSDVFTTASLNGGTAPAYQWYVNGVGTGTGPNFTYIPANGDVVQVSMTSNFPCLTTPTASTSMALTVIPVVQPIGNVYATPGYIIPAGWYDTFTCEIISGGGSAPTYQWLKNAVPVPGATSNVYITNELNTGDSISCEVTNTDECSGISVFDYIIVTVGDNVGVQTPVALGDVVLSPNPNTGIFTIKGTVKSDEVYLDVTDMLGKTIYRRQVTPVGGMLEQRVEMPADIANGLYLLNITGGGAKRSIHFSVQR